MSRPKAPARPAEAKPSPPIRTAMVSTRRLALLFPAPGLDARGRPAGSPMFRLAVALRRRLRLAAARLRMGLDRTGLPSGRVLLAESKMRLRLAALKLRHGRRLRP